MRSTKCQMEWNGTDFDGSWMSYPCGGEGFIVLAIDEDPSFLEHAVMLPIRDENIHEEVTCCLAHAEQMEELRTDGVDSYTGARYTLVAVL